MSSLLCSRKIVSSVLEMRLPSCTLHTTLCNITSRSLGGAKPCHFSASCAARVPLRRLAVIPAATSYWPMARVPQRPSRMAAAASAGLNSGQNQVAPLARTIVDVAAPGGSSEAALIVRDIVEALEGEQQASGSAGAAGAGDVKVGDRAVLAVASDAMQLFDGVDKDKNGALSHIELISALKSHPTLASELGLAKNVCVTPCNCCRLS